MTVHLIYVNDLVRRIRVYLQFPKLSYLEEDDGQCSITRQTSQDHVDFELFPQNEERICPKNRSKNITTMCLNEVISDMNPTEGVA